MRNDAASVLLAASRRALHARIAPNSQCLLASDPLFSYRTRTIARVSLKRPISIW